ncbi:NAD(P)-binding domain-containing protein [Sulfurospirillum sp. T05]|uniref:NAD(P)-binding domain-containing protein n=1 Tax=Sulfurospirillum tamanense TaxID=2813362 RepID=A0ABS2WSH3_9BACT|nr:NAD(P)-binding domain-containing protein [Sulfurospirillum tamanensis]MBN2964621.1 NAD(P)-binding domain-containing protein [Sulfurospirillum tamanensis]
MNCVYDMIVIGGGPGGISATVEAKMRGLQSVLLIEKGENHSQTIRKFYKDNKRVDKDYKGQVVELKGSVQFSDGSKESTLDYFDSLLDNGEIDTAFNSEVESVKKVGNSFQVVTTKAGYEAKNVIVAIGKMGKPNKPDYPIPPSIKQLVNFNLDKCSQGEKLLIVGGGNSAAEYALELSKTNTVTLNYRRPTFSRLNDINEEQLYAYDGQELLRLRLGVDIKSLENASGKVRVNFTDGNFTVYDRVVYAIGGTTPVDFLKKCGITLDGAGHPIFDENYQTEVPGLYIGGDIAVNSGGSIAMALNHSYHIIEHILGQR